MEGPLCATGPPASTRRCRKAPLGVAHGCFWRYHPERAWAWELRLQDEIAPDFRIEEPAYRPGGKDLGDQGDAPHRKAFLRDHPTDALAIVEKEPLRRMGRGKSRKILPEMRLLEPGLWSAFPDQIWFMELPALVETGRRIPSPRARRGRCAGGVRSRKSRRGAKRAARIAELVPPAELFGEGEQAAEDQLADEDEGKDAA